MAQPLTITIVRDPNYQRGDFMQLEVASVVQYDRIVVNPIEGDTGIYGQGVYGLGLYGFANGENYGDGVYGSGVYGLGAKPLDFTSLASFVADDYALRMRGVDFIGNTGSWTSSFTHHHRPNPPPPFQLAASAGVLTWDWTDP